MIKWHISYILNTILRDEIYKISVNMKFLNWCFKDLKLIKVLHVDQRLISIKYS